MSDLKKSKVRWGKENYIPKKVYGFRTSTFKGTQRDIAETFLKENFQQYFKGMPIHGAWVAVHIDTQEVEQNGCIKRVNQSL